MKTIFSAICIMSFFSATVSAQQWNGTTSPTSNINRDGNVSIGTTDASAKLVVRGAIKFQNLPTNNSAPKFLMVDNNGSLAYKEAGTLPASGYFSNKNVVIETGEGITDKYLFFSNMNKGDLGTQGDVWKIGSTVVDSNVGTKNGFMISGGYNSTAEFFIEDGTYNVGIGTTTIPSDYKLAVAGKIIATELKIKLQSNWPDYVFEEDYKLPTLAEVETQIKEKGHLADIPSAKEVVENGFELGEMNKLLLQKIEELTLYMIQQNKVNEKQAKEIEELKVLMSEKK